jgi:hypothetical protein
VNYAPYVSAKNILRENLCFVKIGKILYFQIDTAMELLCSDTVTGIKSF